MERRDSHAAAAAADMEMPFGNMTGSGFRGVEMEMRRGCGLSRVYFRVKGAAKPNSRQLNECRYPKSKQMLSGQKATGKGPDGREKDSALRDVDDNGRRKKRQFWSRHGPAGEPSVLKTGGRPQPRGSRMQGPLICLPRPPLGNKHCGTWAGSIHLRHFFETVSIQRRHKPHATPPLFANRVRTLYSWPRSLSQTPQR